MQLYYNVKKLLKMENIMQIVLERMNITFKSKYLFYEESLQWKCLVSKGMSILWSMISI